MKNRFSILLLSLIATSCSEPSKDSYQESPPVVNEELRQQRIALEKEYDIGSGTLIDIKSIAGKNPKEVEKILGKAGNIEKAKPSGTPCKTNGGCDKIFFQNGKYEVLFINGKSDWITINNVSDFDLNERSIKLLGLPISKPNFSSPSSILRWDNIKGIKEISFFNNGLDKIDYIYIKYKTK